MTDAPATPATPATSSADDVEFLNLFLSSSSQASNVDAPVSESLEAVKPASVTQGMNDDDAVSDDADMDVHAKLLATACERNELFAGRRATADSGNDGNDGTYYVDVGGDIAEGCDYGHSNNDVAVPQVDVGMDAVAVATNSDNHNEDYVALLEGGLWDVMADLDCSTDMMMCLDMDLA